MNRGAFYKNFSWLLVMQATKYFFPLLLIPYLTRVLKPDGYAVYAYVVAYGALVHVFIEYGFNLAGTRFIANEKNIIDKERVSGDIFLTRILLSVFSLVGTFFLSFYIEVFRDNLFFVLAVVLASAAKALLPDFIFQGYERLGALTVRFIFSKVIAIFPVFFFVNTFEDICWVPFFDFISNVVAFFWSYHIAYKLFNFEFCVSGTGRIFKLIRSNFSYFISNMAASSLSGLTTLVIGVSSLNFVEVSYWSIALTAVGAIQALFTPLTNSLYPHIVIHNDIAFVKKILLISTPLVAVGCVIFVCLSEFIVRIIAGAAYLDGVWVMQWLSVLIFLSFFSLVLGWPLLGARGYSKEVATTTVLSSCICLVLLIVIESFFGLTMEALCFIRCFSEFVLAVTRFLYCIRFCLFSTGDRK